MGLDSLTQLIIEYRYWILIPLSIIEGPIVAFFAGTLASLGYFNIVALGIFFFVRDLVFDTLYYALGYYGVNTRFVQKMLHKAGVSGEHLEHVRHLWEKHAGKTMFFGKISYGIAQAIIITAGAVRMSLKKFFGYGAVVAVIQYWGLLAVGYIYGASFGGTITTLIFNLQYVLFGAGLLITGYYVFSFYMRGRFKKYEREEEPTA